MDVEPDPEVSRIMIDPKLFDELKSKLDEDTEVRRELGRIVEELEKDVSYALGVLSRVHSTPRDSYVSLLGQAGEAIKSEINTINRLAEFASKYPYYKFNSRWSRSVQDAVFTVIFHTWLGGKSDTSEQGSLGRLLTIEQVGKTFNVPVNLKDKDAFHITIEEYLLALTNVTEELSRLSTNAVTLGDYELAMRIAGFVRDMHAGFQLLNLKNDTLRKRVDGVKYHVRKAEDVVYDLSVRGLITRNGNLNPGSAG